MVVAPAYPALSRRALGALSSASRAWPGIVITQVSLVASGLILPRLLDPADRGLIGVLLGAFATAGYFSLLGSPISALIAHHRLGFIPSEALHSALVTAALRTIAGVVLTAIALAATGLVTDVSLLLAVSLGTVASLAIPFVAAQLLLSGRTQVAGLVDASPTVVWGATVIVLWLAGYRPGLLELAALWLVGRVLLALATSLRVRIALSPQAVSPQAVSAQAVRSDPSRPPSGRVGLLSPFEVVNPELYVPALLAGPAAAALYIVAAAFLTLPRLVASRALLQVVGSQAHPLSTTSAIVISAGAGLGATVLGVLAIPFLFPPEYASAGAVLPWLGAASVLGSSRRILSAVSASIGRGRLTAISEAVCWIVFAAMLIPRVFAGVGLAEVAVAYAVAAAAALSIHVAGHQLGKHSRRIRPRQPTPQGGQLPDTVDC